MRLLVVRVDVGRASRVVVNGITDPFGVEEFSDND
jgi:hypothetical protein